MVVVMVVVDRDAPATLRDPGLRRAVLTTGRTSAGRNRYCAAAGREAEDREEGGDPRSHPRPPSAAGGVPGQSPLLESI